MRSTAMNRAQRGKLALTAAALGIGLLTSGCGYINPQQTSDQYQASDGIVADLGPLKLSNMLIVSTGEDQPGRVIGAVYNSSSQDVGAHCASGTSRPPSSSAKCDNPSFSQVSSELPSRISTCWL